MLRRLIGEQIDLVWQPGNDLDAVKVDPSQINHVLAEVCLNAKDALDDNGTITISTGSASIDEALCAQQSELIPGEYCTLTISDDGQGMDKETLANIFEPFFTHKDMGQGQGLGMATVYGIIEQNNGFINIASEPALGTCVTIYLPRHTNAAPLSLVTKDQKALLTEDTTTIVLVEDEPENLEMYSTMLKGMGYNVLAVGTPQECLQLSKSYTGRIDLLVTDVVMPDMNGRELADKFITSNPSTKCLFMSGYSAEVITRNGVLVSGINFIEKPFSMQNFATKIKDVLNDPNNQYVSTTGNVISALPIKPNKASQ
jgi:CheY-like chemotaxis protein